MENILETANQFRSVSKYQDALRIYKLYIKENPDDYQGYEGLSYCYLQLKKYETAKENAYQAIQKNPECASAYHQLCIIYYIEDDYETSFSFAEMAYTLSPEIDCFVLHYGLAHFFIGQYDKGFEIINNVVKKNPQDLQAIEYLYSAYTIQGNWKSAQSVAGKMFRLNPSAPYLWSIFFSFFHIRLNTPSMSHLIMRIVILFIYFFPFVSIVLQTPLLLIISIPLMILQGFYGILMLKTNKSIGILTIFASFISLALVIIELAD